MELLRTDNLTKTFHSGGLISRFIGDPSITKALDAVNFSIEDNSVHGLIGESGCGKTTFFNAILGLTEVDDGDVIFKGTPVDDFDQHDWKEFRREVQVVFQDPYDSLDPRMTVRQILSEPLHVHNVSNREEKIHHALTMAELTPPERYLDQRPEYLSGGEKQRVSIARAIILEPSLILADEPTSMLDVSTQAAILQLLDRLSQKMETSMIYISHDLSTVSYVCDTVNVMYLGRIVERALTEDLLNDPKHPYTRGLVQAIPIPDPTASRFRTEIEGAPTAELALGEGCRFRDRCPERMKICERTPDRYEMENGSFVTCFLHGGDEVPNHGRDGQGGKLSPENQ